MVSFKDYCRKHKLKVPLSKEYFDYYTSLGYTCFAIRQLNGHYYLITRDKWGDSMSILTITELKFIIENYNNGKRRSFVKINKYISELRANKREVII